MKKAIYLVIILFLLPFTSCVQNELSQNRINEIDNGFVNSGFSYSFLDSLDINEKTNYYFCLKNIAISMNDKRKIKGIIKIPPTEYED